MLRTCWFCFPMALAVCTLSGCETMPVDGDVEHPLVTISQVDRGNVEVVMSTDDDFVIQGSALCDDGENLFGSIWEVDGFPIELLISAADPSGIDWLRIHTQTGEFTAPTDSSVRIGTRSVPGSDVRFARRDYPADDPRSPQVFSVTVDAPSDDVVVDIEGGASDPLGNDGYTLVIHFGTNQALCEQF